jgi:hypothetical protein
MAYTTTAPSFILFPTTSSVYGFNMAASAHDPRNTHNTYEEFGRILRPSNGQQLDRKTSFTSSLKKLFGVE